MNVNLCPHCMSPVSYRDINDGVELGSCPHCHNLFLREEIITETSPMNTIVSLNDEGSVLHAVRADFLYVCRMGKEGFAKMVWALFSQWKDQTRKILATLPKYYVEARLFDSKWECREWEYSDVQGEYVAINTAAYKTLQWATYWVAKKCGEYNLD